MGGDLKRSIERLNKVQYLILDNEFIYQYKPISLANGEDITSSNTPVSHLKYIEKDGDVLCEDI